MDRLTSMAIFIQVVERGGFAAAAKETQLSASMVAKHVVALESRLGARLLSRTTRRQSLTEAGRLYFERCKSLLAEFDAADATIAELRAAPRGTLRVAAPVSFGAHSLAPALAEFLRLYPEVNIDLALNDRVVDLVDEGIEAAIRIGPLGDSRMIARPLRAYRSMLCASPDYIRRRGRPKLPEELAEHDCISYSLATRRQWRLVHQSGERTAKITPRLQVNNGEALRQAALAGAGIVMQPEVLLADDVKERRLLRVLPEWQPQARKMHLVYLQDRRVTPKLQCFIDFAVRKFR